MQVGLYNPATQYFSGIVLKGEVLKRTATAVYNLHIPLGSPTNTFGNDPARGGTQPNLWGAINGPYSNHEDGDPYATECSGENGGTATSCGSVDARGAAVTNPNPAYNPDGYLWAVDIPAADAGSTVTVSIYDAPFGPTVRAERGLLRQQHRVRHVLSALQRHGFSGQLLDRPVDGDELGRQRAGRAEPRA